MLRSVLILCFAAGFQILWAQSYLPERNNPKIKVKPKANIQAYAFNLRDVRLIEGSPFKNAMDRDAAYLLSISPDRLLHRFYLNAGLPTKGDVYGGWESQGLSGHTLGHYLSACSMMFAATGDKEYKERVDHVVGELAKCQQARKTGYVGAIPKEDSIFWKLQHGIIKTSGFDLNGGWSPWYTVHKVMAGLTDAYLYCDNQKALVIAATMANWTGTILKNLNAEQLEQMRKCEYGGMNDVLVHIYELTANKKYLNLSYKFHDQFILGELAKKVDALQGKHSNTNVPKAIGCARRYEHTLSESDKTIANFFWDTVVKHYTYVIGGNSNYEYLGEPDKLNDRLSDNTCETCNTYNMLKLTRFLYTWKPQTSWMDYYERALYNHILASQNPKDGMMCYFVPLRMGTKKEFSKPFDTFTCCVGSGMENHSKYTEGIYYEGKDGSLFVNLFIPSELNWKSKGVVVLQESTFPDGNKIDFTVRATSPARFVLRIRQPAWAGDAAIQINGETAKVVKEESGYWRIDRTWGKNDKIEFQVHMKLYSESMPDNPNRIALLYGPVVLAGLLGTEMPDPVYGTTVLLTDDHNVANWLRPQGDGNVAFKTNQVAKPADVTLMPFYKVSDQYYNVYWDYFSPADWAKRQTEYEAEKKHQREIETRTIDEIRIGEMQPERDHNLKASEKSYASDALGRMGREVRSGGFFSFEMKVEGETASNLLCSYLGDDKNSIFDLLVDGTKIATQELKGGATGRFFDVEYPIDAALLKGKTSVTVKILAHPNRTAGRVFGCRIVRK